MIGASALVIMYVDAKHGRIGVLSPASDWFRSSDYRPFVKSEERIKVEALDAELTILPKRFGMDELLARIRAALRRTSAE